MTHILIVEDARTVALVLKARLKHEYGITSAVAFTLAEARFLWSPRLYSGVVLDRNLPDGDGLDFIDIVRTASPRMPVIVFAGNVSDMKDNRDSRDNRVTLWLEKGEIGVTRKIAECVKGRP